VIHTRTNSIPLLGLKDGELYVNCMTRGTVSSERNLWNPANREELVVPLTGEPLLLGEADDNPIHPEIGLELLKIRQFEVLPT